jgi:triphosphoribosyl-dephospho-CoA synthase
VRFTPAEIAERYFNACLDELRAPKAGNVHDFSDGHGMTVGDFERSAEVTRVWIAKPGASIGARVRGAVSATRQAVGQNTNLGIVLMSAPIAAAAERDGAAELRSSIEAVLGGLDIDDARDVFAAIMLAAPAGLGDAPQHDVREPASVTLLEAMRSAAHRDRIAWNYSNGFADIFDIGLPCFRDALARFDDWLWATAATHFALMAAFPDTHIFREHGQEAAEAAQAGATEIGRRLAATHDPGALISTIMALDRRLKAAGHNPGTSADLTVATLFCARLGA